MEKFYVGVNIDWSKSFVDPNGSFYCGTTGDQKSLVSKLMPHLDLVVNTTDFHSITSKEFSINGGMWPLHNIAEFRDINPLDYNLDKDSTISPEQTQVIENAINKTKTGIVIPRHVYFQGGDEPSFTPDLVERAFQQKIITPEEFMNEDYTYIISPKMHFDATTIISPYFLPKTNIEKIPNEEFTIFDLIDKKYGKSKEIVYIGTGVVDNICRHYTTTGLRQKYGRRVVNIFGATTELYGVGLGFENKNQVRESCERIQKDIGIEHKTLEEMLFEINVRK
ncbi:MAG: hypothetical protein NUV46_02840 [Nanoarchaeota archaeon]|nr:hypothetical protein [Nanoarchaeota archaeon]